jgi:hypothetical protein
MRELIETEDTLKQNQKVMIQQWKKNKKYTLETSDILWNKSISSKRAPEKRVYAGIKKIFKAGKVLVATTQKVNLKILCYGF